MDRGSSSRESKAPANVKGCYQTPGLLSFSVPPNLTPVVPAALWWLLCVAKQRHPLSMTREEEWQRIKGEEAFPVPRSPGNPACFMGQMGVSGPHPSMPLGRLGIWGLWPLSRKQTRQRVCAKSWVSQCAGPPTLPEWRTHMNIWTHMNKHGWCFFLPSHVSVCP